MKTFMVLVIATVIIFGLGNPGDAATIGFDDMVGMEAGSLRTGQLVSADYIIDDQYLNRGVLFDSEGGGLRVCKAGNAASGPNLVSGTAPGPRLDYNAPVYASFWIDGAPSLVDAVGLTISNFDGSGTLEAYDVWGSLLGSVFDEGVVSLSLNFPGQIHSVIFKPNHAVFDDFTFEGLQTVPIPGAVWLLGSGLFGFVGIRKNQKGKTHFLPASR